MLPLWLELVHDLVEMVGLPLALVVFVVQQRQARRNEEVALVQSLLDQYTEFYKLLLENADLALYRSRGTPKPLTDEQQERQLLLFDVLVALLERAYVLLHPRRMERHLRKHWRTWETVIANWCAREDFRATLPQTLDGADPDFGPYLLRVAADQAARAARAK